MKKYFVIAAFAFAALVSCQKEMVNEEVIPAPVPDNYIGYTLTASTGDQTKSTLDGKKVVWAVGDKVAVFADGAGNALEFEVKEASEAGVMFSGNAPAEASSFVAVYPFDSALGISDGIVKVLIPSEQLIPEGGDIDPTAMPSAAVFETVSSKPTFYNLMSLVKFNVGENEYVDEVRIGTDGEICLAGEIEAKVYAAAEPDVFNNCDENIVIKSEVPLLPNKDYYAVVAPAEGVTGFNAGGVSGSRQTLRSAAEAVTFKRNAGQNLGDITKDAKWLYRYISNADDLKNFLAGAADYPEGWLVEVLEDIQMLGESIPEIEPGEGDPGLAAAAPIYKGDFDGGGYSINGWTSDGVALFGQLYGTIKNLSLASNCTFSNPKTGYFGFMVRELKGKMINCSNAASLSFETDGATQYVFGMLVGRNNADTALMEDCTNSGSIDMTITIGETRTAHQYLGGMVGCVGIPTDESVVRMRNCVSTADHFTVFVDNTAKTNNMIRNFYIGGIAGATGMNAGSSSVKTGYTKCYGTIEGCSSSTNVSASYPNGGSGGYFKLGGILGYAECAIVSCHNSGNISFSGAPASLSGSTPSVAGIAGVLAGTAAVSAKDCVNEGDIFLEGASNNAANAYAAGIAGNVYTQLGGCFGLVGDNTTRIENCDNYGKVTGNTFTGPTAGSSHSLGGVVGYSRAVMSGCDNYGNLEFASSAKTAHFGGIVGYSEKTIENSIFDASMVCIRDVSVLTKAENRTGSLTNIGGIVGYHMDGAGEMVNCSSGSSASVSAEKINTEVRLGGLGGMIYTAVKNCSNGASVTYSRGNENTYKQQSYVAGVIGCHHKDGVEFSDCSNSGAVTVVLDDQADDAYVGGLSGRAKGVVSNCSNSGEIVVDGGGLPNQLVCGGLMGRMHTAGNVTSGSSNTGNLTLTNFADKGEINYLGGLVGNYASASGVTDILKDCSVTCDITVNAEAKVRIGGVASAWYGAFENPSFTGKITASGLAEGSRVAGLAGYGSAPVDGGNINCEINVSAAGAGAAGLLYGDASRNYTIEGITVGGTITTDENVKGGILFGKYYTDFDPASEASFLSAYTIGSAEKPVRIKADSNVNGTKVVAAPATPEDLVGDTTGVGGELKEVFDIVNVIVE